MQKQDIPDYCIAIGNPARVVKKIDRWEIDLNILGIDFDDCLLPELIKKFKYWYLFFKMMNIKIHMDAKDFGQDIIIKYLAMYKLGGQVLGFGSTESSSTE